jgi:prepilin-type processing-associated H-X9-DG protein
LLLDSDDRRAFFHLHAGGNRPFSARSLTMRLPVLVWFAAGITVLFLLAAAPFASAQPVVAPPTPSRAERVAEFDRIIAERDPMIDQFNELYGKDDAAAVALREKIIPLERRSYELAGVRFPGDAATRKELADRVYGSIEYVAGTYKKLKQFAKAEKWYEELETVSADVFGADNWRVRENRAQAAAMKKIAALPSKGQNAYGIGQAAMDETVVLINTGKFDEAAVLADRAIKNVRQTLGDDHYAMGTCFNNLAMIRDRQGKHDEALELFEKSTRISRAALGEHPSTAMSIANHGLSYLRVSDYQGAEPLIRAGYEMRTATLGADDASTCDSAYGLGVVLFNLNRFGEAIPLLVQNAQFLERLHGKEHPEVGNVLFYLGQSLTRVGDFKNAAECLERSVNIRRATFGEENAETLIAIYRLGEVYETAGDNLKCSAYYEQANAIALAILEPNHPFHAMVLNDLGVAYHKMQSYSKALPMFEEALAIRQTAFGEENVLTGISLHNLGMVNRDKGNLDAAEPLLKRAMAVAEKTSGKDSQQYTNEIYAMGGLRHLQKQYDEAARLYVESIARTEKDLGPPSTIGARNDLALVYEAQEKFELARDQIEAMYKIALEQHGPTAPITNQLEQRLTAIYGKTGQQDKIDQLVAAARDRARAVQAVNQLKQLGLGLLNYESVSSAFPAAGSTKVDGAPRLSWRVHILPYVEEEALYSKFHLDEPWDSEHNRKLIAEIPEVFQSPGVEIEAGKTLFLAVTGAGSLFGDGSKGPRMRDVTDGLSNTLMLVEADPKAAVEWTRPDDWEFDAADPTAGVGELRNGQFNVVFCDGHTQRLSTKIDPTLLKSVVTRDGEEIVDFEALEAP